NKKGRPSRADPCPVKSGKVRGAGPQQPASPSAEALARVFSACRREVFMLSIASRPHRSGCFDQPTEAFV
ncbi:hypothetical protein ABTG99_19820, partial [Acinetobacter baumannii]